MNNLLRFVTITLGVMSYALAAQMIDRSLAKNTRKVFRIGASLVGWLLTLYLFQLAFLGSIFSNLGNFQVLSDFQLNLTKVNGYHWALGLGNIGFLGAFVYFVDAAMPARERWMWRWLCGALLSGSFFYVLTEGISNHKTLIENVKLITPIVAIGFLFFEQQRKGQGKPIGERWKMIIGISLALVSISAYFDGYRFGYPKYWHRWDQYHYYMGAKYYPELGYKNLYKCAVLAQDEAGRVTYKLDRPFGSDKHPQRVVDMRKEMRDPDKKIRDLPGENLLVPVGDLLANPGQCKDRFTPERWEQYKKDVVFFRIVSGKGYWTDMQKDHGFNPPPVWTIGGKFFSDLAEQSTVKFHQFLASLDVVYLVGMLIALWWGFGWRVFAVGAIFWGCQSSAPFYWTGGALLRQDWLFFSVLSVACIRRGHHKIAGASLVYAGLLRIFPGLVVVGTLVPTLAHVFKHKKMHPDHLQMLIGGCIAAAVLLPVSVFMTQSDPDAPIYQPYKKFYEHTIETHDQTPLTNHMGLRVIVGHKFFDFQTPGTRTQAEVDGAVGADASGIKRTLATIKWPLKLAKGQSSGQMEYVRDNRLLDPFETWKRMRNERYEKYKKAAYAFMLGTLAFFIVIVRRIKSLWIAQCLGQIFIILGSQLTCYYYSFMILAAPLIKVRRSIELGLFTLAVVTQVIWKFSYWNDNKYTLLTIVSLAFCFWMLGLFARGDAWRRWLADKTGMAWIAPPTDDFADEEDPVGAAA